jgi:hypothetical protein
MAKGRTIRNLEDMQKGRIIRNLDNWIIYQAPQSTPYMSVYHLHSGGKGWGVIYALGRCEECSVEPPTQILEEYLLLTMGEMSYGTVHMRDRIKWFLEARERESRDES